jgi:hypothetical protein
VKKMRQPLQLRRILLVVVAALMLAFGQGSARAATGWNAGHSVT